MTKHCDCWPVAYCFQRHMKLWMSRQTSEQMLVLWLLRQRMLRWF